MLELRNIGFEVEDETTGKKKEILKNINLKIEPEQFVVITGPNGSGKSTLAKIVMGTEQPTSGQILFEGKDITNLDITERAKAGIGFAFQQPVRFKGLLVRDLLRFAAGKNLSTEESCSYLSQVGLCAIDYVNRELNDSLSGGEMKRIEIAMLLARNTKLSIFDEPEAGIDLWSFQNLIKIFDQLRKETKGSVLIISHQERILEIADKIIIITDGEITDEGSKEEMFPKLLGTVDACEYLRMEA
ncbi:ABC transporter ATP-binding protein [Anaerosphaera multitolerans]|uniref:ATP-binding cassette domain-containing protein n=1 Tax=Anaerosphaera multitolerans TaxID=2487351 RepID=A0A437S751_9FIRM|nr:ATP-binding cassette domain-containing protein [Anaerosphaera multitolerans]RVU54801.1 ATP-binding cassette domain-containing protein [Anaerosphaera multitolerans]